MKIVFGILLLLSQPLFAKNLSCILTLEKPSKVFDRIPALESKSKFDNVEINTDYVEFVNDVKVSGNIKKLDGESVGGFQRTYRKDKNSLEFFFIETKAESTTPGVIGVNKINLDDKGYYPLSLMINVGIFKGLKIPYGSLSELKTGSIVNRGTKVQLMKNPKIIEYRKLNPDSALPTELIAEAIWETNTGRYIESFLNVTGHDIDEIAISYGRSRRARGKVRKQGSNKPVAFSWKSYSKKGDDGERVPRSFKIQIRLKPKT